MVAAPGAAPPRLASAALRWPRRGPAASPPPRARRLRERRPEIGWSRDGWRCTAANKPALAGLGEIKNKTNKLAKRLGGWGGAWAAGPGVLVPARRWRARGGPEAPTSLPRVPRQGNERAGPEDLDGCWQLDVRLGGDLVFSALRAAGGRRLAAGALPAAGLSPAALTWRPAGEAGKCGPRGCAPRVSSG